MMLAIAAAMLLQAAPVAGGTAAAWPEDLPPCPAKGETTRFYPDAALMAGLEGEVVLRCTVGDSRRFASCQVIEETPAGVNFGLAALALARCSKAPPKKVGETVVSPVHYRIPGRGTPQVNGGVTVIAR